ncbi:AEC family transporter [Desulfobacter postgatei]|uniref:AEC family transporter n=1 Tax=Desulfobacter postgatei TaxID=2293 RepID=UPI00259B7FF0|nr:AEC family transporter [uncultured Desulfobacter sp.]
MAAFISLFINLLPLYAIIAAGYFAGRVFKVDIRTMASLSIYFFLPVVIFGFVSNMAFKPLYIMLPAFIYIDSTITALSFYALGKRIYKKDSRANLMALCSAMGNTGYFGLPLVLLFFNKDTVGIYVFMMLGVSIFEATIGYYIAARGNFNVRDSLIKLLKFPSIYAIATALIVNAMDIELPDMFWTYWTHVKGCYVIIGMMIIGVVLGSMRTLVFDLKLTALVFIGKFLAIPLLGGLFIWLDRAVLHMFTTDIYHLIVLITIVPSAANVVAFSAQLNVQPEKAATTVLAGTIFALFYIPTVVWLIGM